MACYRDSFTFNVSLIDWITRYGGFIGIWGCRGGDYKHYCPLECDSVSDERATSFFRVEETNKSRWYKDVRTEPESEPMGADKEFTKVYNIREWKWQGKIFKTQIFS
jgi:hypothetical protein